MKITFNSKIAKKGEKLLIWIPKNKHDEIKDFEKNQLKILIKTKKSNTKSFIKSVINRW